MRRRWGVYALFLTVTLCLPAAGWSEQGGALRAIRESANQQGTEPARLAADLPKLSPQWKSELRTALGDSDPAVRVLAARLAGAAGDPTLATLLPDLLGDGQRTVRDAAAEALAALGVRSVPHLERVLLARSSSVVTRCAAAKALGEIPGIEAARALVKGLFTVNVATAEDCIQRVLTVCPMTIQSILEFQGGSREERIASLLASLPKEEVLPNLLVVMRDSTAPPAIRREAVRQLPPLAGAAAASRHATEFLRSVANDTSIKPQDKARCVRDLPKPYPEDFARLLLSQLQHPASKEAALAVIMEMQEPAYRVLITNFTDPRYSSTRQLAAFALTELPSLEPMAPLLAWCKQPTGAQAQRTIHLTQSMVNQVPDDPDPIVRLAWTRLAGVCGNQVEAVSLLRKMLGDNDKKVVEAAQEGLKKIGAQEEEEMVEKPSAEGIAGAAPQRDPISASPREDSTASLHPPESVEPPAPPPRVAKASAPSSSPGMLSLPVTPFLHQPPLGQGNGLMVDTSTFEEDLRAILSKRIATDAATKNVACYRYRQEADLFLGEYPWFRFWRAVSPSFGRELDQRLHAEISANSSLSKSYSVPAEPFQNRGMLLLKTDTPGACVYLNAVFAGRTPLPETVLPAGRYAIRVVTAERTAETEVVVNQYDRVEVTIRDEDFHLPPPDGERISPLPSAVPGIAWFTPIGEGEAADLYPTGNGAMVFIGGENPRFKLFDRLMGDLAWETPIALPPRSTPVNMGARTFWVADDGFLHALDMASGSTSLLFPLRGELAVQPLPGAGYLPLGVWEDGKGGFLHLLAEKDDSPRWSRPLDGRPLFLLPLNGLLLAVIRDEDTGVVMAEMVDTTDGKILWSRYVRDHERMVAAGEGRALFLWNGDDQGAAWYFADAADGERVLDVRLEGGGAFLDALLSGQHLFLLGDGTIRRLNLESRSLDWTLRFAAETPLGVRLRSAGSGALALVPEDAGEDRSASPLLLFSSRRGRVTLAVGVVPGTKLYCAGPDMSVIAEPSGEITARDLAREMSLFRLLPPDKDEKEPRYTQEGSRGYLLLPKAGHLYAFDF